MTSLFLYAVEREYPVTIDKLWAAWVDEAALQAWYCPTDLSVVPGSVTNEVRVGGTWAAAVDVPAASFVAYFYGTYSEVVPNQRMVHSMQFTGNKDEFDSRAAGPAHNVVIEFEDRGSSSWVKFSQYGELPEGEAPRAQAGMTSYFDNLGKYLER